MLTCLLLLLFVDWFESNYIQHIQLMHEVWTNQTNSLKVYLRQTETEQCLFGPQTYTQMPILTLVKREEQTKTLLREKPKIQCVICCKGTKPAREEKKGCDPRDVLM